MRALLLLALLAACGKDEGGEKAAGGSAGAAAPAAPASPRDSVIDAWKKGGLAPSPMTAATVAFGKDCQSGTVNSIDVLVCVYASPDEAKAAEKAGYEWVGGATGASTASGSVLIAIADRRKSDPSGRTINQMMKLAPAK